MNGILFIDFNLPACDFLKFDWCKMLNGYVRRLYQSKSWKIEDDLNETWNTSNFCIFLTETFDLAEPLL